MEGIEPIVIVLYNEGYIRLRIERVVVKTQKVAERSTSGVNTNTCHHNSFRNLKRA